MSRQADCPYCKGIFDADIDNFLECDEGDGFTIKKCPHCQNMVKVEYEIFVITRPRKVTTLDVEEYEDEWGAIELEWGSLNNGD